MTVFKALHFLLCQEGTKLSEYSEMRNDETQD